MVRSELATRVSPRELLAEALSAVTRVVWGHEEAVKLALAAVVARGHILFEDVPGVGKTTLARALARVLGCSFARVQFTSDMLPSDVLGLETLDRASGTLRFRPGPIFSQVVLADEINRASPKTQSAMLEAMAERHVTVDDTTHELGAVFIVLATQNPLEHHGAYPLPESQLDRFMVRLSLGYPPAQEERRLLLSPAAPESALEKLPVALGLEQLIAAQEAASAVLMSEAVADYVLAIVSATRSHADVLLGASPRAAMSFAGLARAWAYLHGRDFVVPDDIQTLVRPVLSHRLVMAQSGGLGRHAATTALNEILAATPVPR